MLEDLKELVVDGDADEIGEAIQELLDGQENPLTILNDALLPGMDEVADMWKSGEYFMSDVILSANAFSKAMDIVSPELEKSGVEKVGKYLIGVVEGDMHDLGKNIVVAMMKANGFEVVDIGVDQPVESFVEAVRHEKPDILGIGAYMSTTIPQLKMIIDALEEAGLREGLLIEVGGVCINDHIAAEAGADIWGGDAMHTVEIAKQYLEVA